MSNRPNWHVRQLEVLHNIILRYKMLIWAVNCFSKTCIGFYVAKGPQSVKNIQQTYKNFTYWNHPSNLCLQVKDHETTR